MSGWKRHLLAAPSVAVSVLPKFACPACASAAVGILSSVGLGYLLTTRYLLPLTSALLLLALATLGFRASTRHGYAPLLLGSVAAAVVLLGKFHWEYNAVVYIGVGLLVISSLWNAWPRRSAVAACPACETERSN